MFFSIQNQHCFKKWLSAPWQQAIYGTNPPRPEFDLEYRNVVREIRDLIWTEEQINLLLDPLAARTSGLVNADRDRWIGASGGSESPPPIETVINDMKKFACGPL